MSEMIERVAKAQAGWRWDQFDEEHKNACRDLARSAIEAMREPTVEMLISAQEEWLCVRAAEERGDFIWRAMIDTALNAETADQS